jgi:hypothetical protein
VRERRGREDRERGEKEKRGSEEERKRERGEKRSSGMEKRERGRRGKEERGIRREKGGKDIPVLFSKVFGDNKGNKTPHRITYHPDLGEIKIN